MTKTKRGGYSAAVNSKTTGAWCGKDRTLALFRLICRAVRSFCEEERRGLEGDYEHTRQDR